MTDSYFLIATTTTRDGIVKMPLMAHSESHSGEVPPAQDDNVADSLVENNNHSQHQPQSTAAPVDTRDIAARVAELEAALQSHGDHADYLVRITEAFIALNECFGSFRRWTESSTARLTAAVQSNTERIGVVDCTMEDVDISIDQVKNALQHHTRALEALAKGQNEQHLISAELPVMWTVKKACIMGVAFGLSFVGVTGLSYRVLRKFF